MSNQSKAYKLFAFDIDGVLLESVETHFLSFRDSLLDVVGYTLTRQEHDTISAMSTKQKLNFLVDQNRLSTLTDHQLAEITRLKFEYMFRYMDHLDFNPEVHSMISYAKSKGIKVCLVSNARTEYIKLVINMTNCSNLIDGYFGNDKGYKPKPYPDMYLAAMKSCGASPDTTVIFEDSEVGLQAATSSGANVMKVTHHHQVTRELLVNIIEENDFSTFYARGSIA